MASGSKVFLSSEKVDKVLDEILSHSESNFFDSVGSIIIYQLVRLLLWKEQNMMTVIVHKM
jgi:hypothetical protein